MGDKGSETIQLLGFFAEGEEEFVDVVLEVFGVRDIDDLEVLDVAGRRTGNEVA